MSSESGSGQQQRQRSSDARKRWRLLARALTGSSVDGEDGDEEDEEEVSVRRFGSFGLLKQSLLGSEPDCTWWLYSGKLGRRFRPQLLVSTFSNAGFSAEQLVGFNNTGNVCVWPSEECLAYYLLKRPELCRGRRVLELGGGMSCLAGALAAKYCSPQSITLTDGNADSVANAGRIVERNGLAPIASCAVVQWARAAKALSKQQRRSLVQELSDEDVYDVILCADCLFFDEARLDLVDTIYGWLSDDGLALVMAPYRGSTFRKFVDAMVQKGFAVRQSEIYDSEIWARHLHLLATNRDYCPDLHYPVLLEFTKKRITPRADYWKSQDRKYCDFCKCWIADNKPSIQFHESGKRHKENVTKRVKEIHKNSIKQAKQQKKFENDIQQMEKAAMAAYLKDVEGNTRDMMADKIIEEKWNKAEERKVKETPNFNQTPDAEPGAHPRSSGSSYYERTFDASDIDPLDPYAKQKLARLDAKQKAKAKKEAKEAAKKEEQSNKTGGSGKGEKSHDQVSPSIPIRKVWYEARSQGHSYYWNIDTNEAVWEPPLEGFMSLDEQAEEAKEQELQEKLMEEIEKEQEKEKAIILEERRANEEREKLKEIRKQLLQKEKADRRESGGEDGNEDEDLEKRKIPYRRDYSVPEKPQPYGSWQVVRKIETPKIDLQLPRVRTTETFTPTIVQEPPPARVFKEKVITHISPTSSDDEGPSTSFKKQKFSSFKRKNIRKRTTDD